MFQTPLEDERSAAPRKHFIDRAHDYYKLQLHPGEKLDIVQEPFLGSIDESLQWQNISGKYVLEATHDTKTVSIYGWCSEVLLLATTKAFFGDSILQIEPNILQGIHDFDNASWKLIYQIPRFWAKDMWEAKDLVHGALLKYFKLPLGQRSDGAWVVQTLESEMRDMGVDDQQIASILMMTYWVYASVSFPAKLSWIHPITPINSEH